MGPLKHGGLALATTLSASCNMLMLLWFLRRKIGSFGGMSILTTTLKSTAATIPMSAVVWYGCSFVDWSQTDHKLLKGMVLSGSIMCGCVVYMLTAKLLRSEEVLEAVSMLRSKLMKG
jgi:putative peptidoglycan lipid II flippase